MLKLFNVVLNVVQKLCFYDYEASVTQSKHLTNNAFFFFSSKHRSRSRWLFNGNHCFKFVTQSAFWNSTTFVDISKTFSETKFSKSDFKTAECPFFSNSFHF